MPKKLKIFFTFIGLLSLILILKSYGFNLLFNEFKKSGLKSCFLVLTFLPTLLLYSLSWLLVTNLKDLTSSTKKQVNVFIWSLRFSLFTLISLSWNNLTPFFKVGGEPVKFFLLNRYLSKRDSLSSTITYNILHICSTLLSFILASSYCLIFLDIKSLYQNILLTILLISCLLFLLVFYFFFFSSSASRFTNKLLKNKFKKIRVNFIYGLRKSRRYSSKHSLKFILALFLDTFARFTEGLTFYFAYRLIERKMSPISASLLDVCRTMIDNLLFFIPYQVGGREAGIKLVMTNIISLPEQGFLFLGLSYRFIEIFWVIIGYILWLKMSDSKSS